MAGQVLRQTFLYPRECSNTLFWQDFMLTRFVLDMETDVKLKANTYSLSHFV